MNEWRLPLAAHNRPTKHKGMYIRMIWKSQSSEFISELNSNMMKALARSIHEINCCLNVRILAALFPPGRESVVWGFSAASSLHLNHNLLIIGLGSVPSIVKDPLLTSLMFRVKSVEIAMHVHAGWPAVLSAHFWWL